MSLTKPHVPKCGPLTDICFLVLLDLLVLEVRPLEFCVKATVFNQDFMLGVFNRLVRFSPCTVSVYSGMIQEQLYPLFDGQSVA